MVEAMCQTNKSESFHANAVAFNISPLFPMCLNINFQKFALSNQGKFYSLKIKYLVFLLIFHIQLLLKHIIPSAFYVHNTYSTTKWNNVIWISGSRKSNSSFQDLLPLRNVSVLPTTYKNYLRLQIAVFWGMKLCSLLHVTDV